MASCRPKPWVETPNAAWGKGAWLTSKRCTVPAGAPDAQASIISAAEAFSSLARMPVASPSHSANSMARGKAPRKACATARPAPSSPRPGLPTPNTRTLPTPASPTVQLQPQEVGGAGDARVVVAHGLLAAVTELIVGQVQPLADEARQIGFDAGLVLGRGRNNARLGDAPIRLQAVAMVEQATRRLGGRTADASTRLDLHGWLVRRLVGIDDPQRVVAGVERLHRSHDDAAVGKERSEEHTSELQSVTNLVCRL